MVWLVAALLGRVRSKHAMLLGVALMGGWVDGGLRLVVDCNTASSYEAGQPRAVLLVSRHIMSCRVVSWKMLSRGLPLPSCCLRCACGPWQRVMMTR